MKPLYYTYTISTIHNSVEYLISELGKQRLWTLKEEQAMLWFSKEEVKDVIKLFNIPKCKARSLPRYE